MIAVGRLRDILRDLGDDWQPPVRQRLPPTGNLAVMTPNGEQFGYIDMERGELVVLMPRP